MVSNADDDEELSGSDADEGFDEDMEALRRACILTGTDPEALQPSSASASAADTTDGTVVPGGGAVSDSEEDDLELVRGIQQRFSACTHAEAPLFLKPLSTLPPAASDDDEDDFETLRAIQRRFAGYDKDSLEKGTDNCLNKLEQVHATNIALEKEICNSIVVDRTDVSKGFPDSLDVYNTSQNSESFNDITDGICPSGLIEWHQPDTHDLAIIPPRGSGFPKSAQMFVDAIKKNRACQKFLRSKLIQIEARIEENKKLKQRVKILKDFQVTCKKRTGRALSQKKDARVQLISVTKPRSSSKVNGKKVPALYYGPDENSRVASYRMVLTKFPISLSREKWSDEERENLAKGIRQQFQELLLQKSVDLISDVEGSSGDSNDFDSIIATISDLDITPETIRSFLPKVNWERLASMYITGRSGSECEARWLNCEDPLINHHLWTKLEDKKLLHIVQQRGINNWIDIAILLGTNRTPFQCLARYQRSLNASILKREWTEDEDDKLRAAVEDFGESNWQVVASTLEGRTGTQCSNRWIKSLHPARQRVGRWTLDEDKRLKVAVMLFGPKTWKKVAQFVPGRTHVQCRERWFNSLDPSLNLGEWTEEEDSRLKVAITEHGYCWSKVAACVPPRTDSQCRRRWKVLLPHEVPLLQAARKLQKAALISNFVDRESERPALGPNDFVPLALTNTVSESENVNPSGKQKRKSRKWSGSKGNGKVSSVPKFRSKRLAKEAQICSDEVLLLTNGNEVENIGSDDVISKKKRVMEPRLKKKSCSEPTQNVMGNGEEVMPFDWGTKKKKSFGRRKWKFRSPEAKEIDTVAMDDAISMKQRAMKPCSKKNKSSDPTKTQLPACADSELLFVTNGEEVGEIGGDDGAKNKKASKPGRRKSKCVKLTDEISGMIKLDEVVRLGENDAVLEKNKKPSLPHLKQDNCTNPTQVHSSSGPDSTSLRITNLNKVKAFGDDGARKKNALKLCSRRKYSKLMQELLELTDSSDTETLGSNNAILKKERVTKQSLKKCIGQNHSSSSKLLTTTANEVEAFGGNDATKKRKAFKPCTRSKCPDPPKQSKSPPLLPAGLETSRADDGIETSDVDNSTLRRKKRARNVHPRRKGSKQSGEHKDLTSSCISVSKLQSKQSGTTKLVAGSQSTSLPQKCSTSVLSDNGNSRASGICPQQRLKRSRTRERTCSNDIMVAEDGDDMSLACFIKNKTKKRRLKLAEKGNDASYPDNMKGSELLYENCRNDGRNDVLSYQAMQSSHPEDPARTVAREIDCEDSHMVAGGTSPLHASLKEPLSIDVEGDSEAGDDPSERHSPPPGFENPIYRRVAA